jgi:hypothetical protein
MRLRALIVTVTGVVAAMLGLVAAPTVATAADAPPSAVQVTLDRSTVTVMRGDTFTMRSVVTNGGSAPTGRLLAHLSVASRTATVSVDPEDWTPAADRHVEPLAPGASASLDWDLKAGDVGTFALYVTLLPAGSAQYSASEATSALSAISPIMRVDAAGRGTLNAAGVLPVVILIPALLGLVAILIRWRIRRAGRTEPRRVE